MVIAVLGELAKILWGRSPYLEDGGEGGADPVVVRLAGVADVDRVLAALDEQDGRALEVLGEPGRKKGDNEIKH